MKKVLLCQLLFALLFSIACNLGFTPTNNYYYIQQQTPSLEVEDSKPAEDVELSFGIMFDILEPNGVINQSELETYLDNHKDALNANSELLDLFYMQLQQLPIIKKEQDASFPLDSFNSSDFSDKLIRAKFSAKNVPEMWYEDEVEDNVWGLSDDTMYLSPVEGEENISVFFNEGPKTSAGTNAITDVVYFKYEKKNPFYAIDSKYNTDKIADGSSEAGMDRFLFYRFQGKGGGIVALDNMLVAVDTYTSLIFAFGVPTDFLSILGQDSPTKWDPAEVAASAPDGKKYKFYEYDPAGYVSNDGTFVMYDWYIDNLSKANAANQTNFYPQFTGVSPYLVNLELKRPIFTVTSEQADENNRYYTEVSGFKFKDAPKDVASFSLYRIDDSSTERKLLEGNLTSDSVVKDYNALLLTGSAKYIIEALDGEGNVVGAASNSVEGTRTLTERETLLRIIESMRYALIDEGAYGSSTKKEVQSENGGTFTYSKSGLFTVIYNYELKDFSPYGIALSSILDDGTPANITYASKNLFSSIKTSVPFTGTIHFTDGANSGTLTFNNITINNNDKNAPDWTSGTLDYTFGTNDTVPYSNTGEIPFGFYMTKDAFISAIMGEEGEYTQM